MSPKYDSVLLAAGRSRRMGKWKLTLPLQDTTIVERAVSTALDVSSRVILVTGYQGEILEDLLRKSDVPGRERLCFVHNQEYERGMFSSIRKGCEEVETERFFLVLGDMPLVNASTYQSLIETPEVDAVIPKYKGKRGHPLLMMRSMADRIIAADKESTLHHVLSEVPTMSIPVNDRYILNDVDTEKDYLEMKRETESAGGE